MRPRCILAIVPIVSCLVLCSPRSSAAHEILFPLTSHGYGGSEVLFTFGLDFPFRMLEAGFQEVFLDNSLVLEGNVGGIADIVSGPLLDLTVEGDHSVYKFGPGTVSINGSWQLPDDSFGHGTFSAPLLDLTIELCEDCDFGGLAMGDVTATLGPGLFDSALAEILGISGPSSGGLYFFGPDLVEGDPSSPWRVGGSHTGDATLIVTVPEPSVTALTLCGVLLACRRRSLSRARN